jgi:hypothetical protein
MPIDLDRNPSRNASSLPKKAESSLTGNEKINIPESSIWTPGENAVETSPEPSETPPDEPEGAPNAVVAAEESSNRYIIVQPPDDSGAGETNEDVPVFTILLLIVLAVAIVLAFIYAKKKRAAGVEAGGYPPIRQSVGNNKNDKEGVKNFGQCNPNVKPNTSGFMSGFGRGWEAEYEAKNERRRLERMKNRQSEAEYYAKKYDIPIEEFYPNGIVHKGKPKKKGVSEASGKPSSPPKMKPPLSY